MRPAALSLLLAAERTAIAEDQLTEVLASALQTNSAFAARFLRDLGGVTPAERVVVGTQRRTVGKRRVDLEVRLYDGNRQVGLVWVEVKEWADYQPSQLEDYAEDVVNPSRYGHADGRLLVLVPPQRKKEEDMSPTERGPRWGTKTWGDVAWVAEQCGRDWRGRDWLAVAHAANGPAQWRYLADFIDYLDHKGYAPMNQPIGARELFVAQNYDSFDQAITAMVDAALEAAPGGPISIAGRRSGWARPLDRKTPAWTRTKRWGKPRVEFGFQCEDEVLEEPAFYLSLVFNGADEGAKAALLDEDWQRRADVSSDEAGESWACYWMYLSELMHPPDRTFEEQAAVLGAWVEACSAKLATLPNPLARTE